MNHEMCANPNENYQILIDILSKAKEIHISKTERRYNKRMDKKEKCITIELLIQINKKNDMYGDWKTKSTKPEMCNNKKINIKIFENVININIAETKRTYYHNTFRKYKNDMKKTWKVINKTLGKRNQKTNPHMSIELNNTLIPDPNKIVNTFNNYFANIGTDLANCSTPLLRCCLLCVVSSSSSTCECMNI